MTSPDPTARAEAMARLRALAVATQGARSASGSPPTATRTWRELLDLLDDAAADGGRLWGQSSCRPSVRVFNFRTWLPFDKLPRVARAAAPSARGAARALRDPDVRRRARSSAVGDRRLTLGKEAATDVDLRSSDGDAARHPRDADARRASPAERGVHPVELMIDLVARVGLPCSSSRSPATTNADDVLTILRHPRTVMTFSDAGAHVCQILNASIQTHLLELLGARAADAHARTRRSG